MRTVCKSSETICYCFNYSAEDIKEDVLENSRSLIMEHIKAEKRKDGCNCGQVNPKGR